MRIFNICIRTSTLAELLPDLQKEIEFIAGRAKGVVDQRLLEFSDVICGPPRLGFSLPWPRFCGSIGHQNSVSGLSVMLEIIRIIIVCQINHTTSYSPLRMRQTNILYLQPLLHDKTEHQGRQNISTGPLRDIVPIPEGLHINVAKQYITIYST